MATFKAEVYAHQKRADGTYNIKIRIVHNRRKKYLPTVWYVTSADITRSFRIKNQEYIDYTDDLIRRYRRICDRAGDRLRSMTVEQVAAMVTTERLEAFDLDIVKYTRDLVAWLKADGHEGNARSYEVAINSLVRFVGRESISVREITVRLVKDWIRALTEMPARSGRERGTRAQSLYPAQLRSVLNMAKREFNDEEAGVINIPNPPFRQITLPKVQTRRKRAVTVAQLRSLAALEYSSQYQSGVNRTNLAKDVFLLSFFLMGMNAADLYTCDRFRDGVITYYRQKTRGRRADRAEMRVRVQPEAMPLFEKYRDPTGERVFRFHRMYSTVNVFSDALNKGLKRIGVRIGEDDLEFYAARHTWATVAINEVGIDKYTVHEALDHVVEEMRVTDTYIRRSWERLARANRKVIEYVCLDYGTVKEPEFGCAVASEDYTTGRIS